MRSPSGNRADKRTPMSESILCPSPSQLSWILPLLFHGPLDGYVHMTAARNGLKRRYIGSTVRANAGIRPRKSSTHNPAIWQYKHA